jgi:hypothetical protein
MDWKSLKTTEDVIPYTENFVMFECNPNLYQLIDEILVYKCDDKSYMIGYIHSNPYDEMSRKKEMVEKTYHMDILVEIYRNGGLYAQIALKDSILEYANMKLRFLTIGELEEIYSILFIKVQGKMNGSISGIHFKSIADQLINYGYNQKLPNHEYVINKYLHESIGRKYL